MYCSARNVSVGTTSESCFPLKHCVKPNIKLRKCVVQDQADWKHSLQRHPGNKPGDGGQQQEVEVSSEYPRRDRRGVSRLHVYLCVWEQFIWQELELFISAEMPFPAARHPHPADRGSDLGGARSGSARVEEGQAPPAPAWGALNGSCSLFPCLFTLFWYFKLM